MTTITAQDSQRAIAEVEFGLAKKHWVLLLILGIMMIIFGMIGFMQPVAYTVATTVLFGALLLVNGGAGIVTAFKLEGWKGKTAVILLALLFIATGMMLILHPVLAAISLTLLVGAFLIASGGIKAWLGVSHREHKGWGWIVASGAISFLLGILIFGGFPGSGLWLLGLFVAIELLFDGWGLVMLAIAAQAARE